jgi:hypothetical protein
LAPRGFHKDLGLFQTAATFNFDPSKIFGLTVQFAHGRQDGTAQLVDLWNIGLSLHF